MFHFSDADLATTATGELFKTAVIQQRGFLSTVVQTLVKAFPQTQAQFYDADERCNG